MSIENKDFKTAGNDPGCASRWTFAAHSQFETASFDSASAETFDWVAAYAYTLEPNLARMLFNDDQHAVEAFSVGWNGNQDYVLAIDGGIAAQFDSTPEAFEDFEEDWSSNQSYKFSFSGVGVDLTAASFDSTPEAFEDFEEDWSSNQSYKYNFIGVGVDLTAASFDSTPEAFEDFEEDWPTLVMTTI